MTTKDLSKFESNRRYATLAAIAVEARATLIDQIVDLHDRVIDKIFSKAKRTQTDRLQQSSKSAQPVPKNRPSARAKGIWST